MKKELAWLRRGAPARTAKPKFRIEAANDLIADVPQPRDSMALSKMATARLGKDVLDLEHVSLAFDGARPLFDNITLRLAPGERLGIVGVNGAGKSTLLRLLNGELEPTSGRIKRGKTVKTAILTQEVRELDELADKRVIEVIERESAPSRSAARRSPPASWSSSSGSAPTSSGPRSGSSPAASGGACSCCACWWASRTS